MIAHNRMWIASIAEGSNRAQTEKQQMLVWWNIWLVLSANIAIMVDNFLILELLEIFSI